MIHADQIFIVKQQFRNQFLLKRIGKITAPCRSVLIPVFHDPQIQRRCWNRAGLSAQGRDGNPDAGFPAERQKQKCGVSDVIRSHDNGKLILISAVRGKFVGEMPAARQGRDNGAGESPVFPFAGVFELQQKCPARLSPLFQTVLRRCLCRIPSCCPVSW